MFPGPDKFTNVYETGSDDPGSSPLEKLPVCLVKEIQASGMQLKFRLWGLMARW